MMDTSPYIQERIHECEKITICDNYDEKPQNKDDRHWYFVGMHDAYYEVYLILNGFDRYSQSHFKD